MVGQPGRLPAARHAATGRTPGGSCQRGQFSTGATGSILDRPDTRRLQNESPPRSLQWGCDSQGERRTCARSGRRPSA
jgi:hypothetical protein